MIEQSTWKFRRVGTIALTVVIGVLGAGLLRAQAPAPDQQKPAPKPPTESNPFPDDTSNVPVVPDSSAPATPEANAPAAHPVTPSGPDDPVRSPDDPVGNPESDSSSGFSSSTAGTDKLAPPPDDTRGRRGKGAQEPQPHQETAKEDENVGGYYLSSRNWQAALSRFESAVVLDPENPDVYWGLAESQRHLGQFAAAKANYQKVMEYDPDSKHAKEAKKLISEPELAKAASVVAPQR